MPYYRIQLGNRQSVIKDERTLQEVGESYKDRLIGECDYLGHLQVPYISPEAEAMLKEAAEEFNATHTWVDGKLIKVYNPDGERGSPIQDPINTDNVAETVKVATHIPYNNDAVNKMIEGNMQDMPIYGKAIMAQKDALGLSLLDKCCIQDGYEFPIAWDLADRLPERMSPTYKRRWNIEINGSSYWIYAMHDSQVEHYTKMYGEGEAPKTVEYQIEARKPDPVEEAFEVQTPVTPEEVGVVELTPGGSYADDRDAMVTAVREMSFARSKPTKVGGFTVPIHVGVALSKDVERYRQILEELVGKEASMCLNDADLLKVMPRVLETVGRMKPRTQGCVKCDHSIKGCSYCETYFSNGISPKLHQWLAERKATLQPDPVELTPIEEAAVEDAILTVGKFKVRFPEYPIEVYHDYLSSKMAAYAKAGKPFVITDQDTLAEAQITIQGKSAFDLARIQYEGLGLDQFINGLLGEQIRLNENDPDPLGKQHQEQTLVVRKNIILQMDQWWAACQTRFDIANTFGTTRRDFICKEYLRHRKYVKRQLLEIIEPHDTMDDIKIDLTQWNTFNLLGRDADGEWFRPLTLTFNTRGHFELFEGLDD